MARAINDINAIRMACGMGLVALTDGLVLGMTAIGFMMSINAKLTLISLIPTPIIIVLTRILTRRMSASFESVQKIFSDLTERVREAFAGIRIIKAYSRESWEYQRVGDEGRRYILENMRLAKTLAFFFPMMTVFTNVGLAVVILLGGRLTILGDITTGDFVAFTSYLNLLTWPMMALGWVTNMIQRGSASMRRINRILEQVPEIKDSARSRHVPRIRGKIEIKGLSIIYPGQTHYALKDIELKINAEETAAIVGRVGSGKTTLLHVIPRFLDVSAGSVFLEGRDILQIPLSRLRGSIGFVTQETFVFSDTIRNNVLFGRSGVSKIELEAALQAADIFEDTKSLHKGLDTILGERGITLSGGQRQRLTVARALILDPPILILDDALSMVDTRTEQRILNQVLKLRQHKTNLIVSQRASTIQRADRIIVLDRGELAEQGPHKKLMELKGIYATLYKKQRLAQALEDEVE
jgi:ATP-binding cassette subfamily B protein